LRRVQAALEFGRQRSTRERLDKRRNLEGREAGMTYHHDDRSRTPKITAVYTLKSRSALLCAMRARSAGLTGMRSRNARASVIDPYG